MPAATDAPPRVAVPILRSLLSADALAGVLARVYGLEDVRCSLIKAVLLDTYMVKSRSGPYILRVYPAQRRTEAQVYGELDFLAHLVAADVPVSAPVPLPDGNRAFEVDAPEGVRLGVLFAFAPGKNLGDDPKPAHYREYGGLLARLHRAADAFPHPIDRPALGLAELVDGPLEELVGGFGPRSSAGIMARHAVDLIRPALAELPTEPPVWGLSHGDTGPGNVLVTPDGRMTLLDFDFCGPGWRAHDLAAVVNDAPDDAVRPFLEGYDAVRDITPREMEVIPHFQVAHHLWVLATRTRFLNEWGTWFFTDQMVIATLGTIQNLLSRIQKR